MTRWFQPPRPHATANQFRLLIHTAAYWADAEPERPASEDLLLARCPVGYDLLYQDRPAERFPLSGRLRRIGELNRAAAPICAFGWGFSSLATFYRAFEREFGMFLSALRVMEAAGHAD